MIGIDSLERRREKLSLKFAKQCLGHEKLKGLFPRHERRHNMEKRNIEKYIVNNAKTERYRKSAIPSMQRLLNQSEREKSEILKRIKNYCPSELWLFLSYHCENKTSIIIIIIICLQILNTIRCRKCKKDQAAISKM